MDIEVKTLLKEIKLLETKLSKHYNAYLNKISNYSDLKDKAVFRLKEICQHEDRETKSVYFEGGYLNTAYSEHTTKCNICGKIINVKEENHGSYN